MCDDYMITYDNYYGINEKDDKARYDAVKLTWSSTTLLARCWVPTYGSLDFGADYAAWARVSDWRGMTECSQSSSSG